MRRLTFIVLILAAIYAGYWFIGVGAMEKSAADQFNDLEKSGWQVDYTDLSTAGFPSRFDTTVNDLTLTTPGWGDTVVAAVHSGADTYV